MINNNFSSLPIRNHPFHGSAKLTTAIEFNADRNITRDRFPKPRIYQSGMVSRFPRRYLNSAEIYTPFTQRCVREGRKKRRYIP